MMVIIALQPTGYGSSSARAVAAVEMLASKDGLNGQHCALVTWLDQNRVHAAPPHWDSSITVFLPNAHDLYGFQD